MFDLRFLVELPESVSTKPQWRTPEETISDVHGRRPFPKICQRLVSMGSSRTTNRLCCTGLSIGRADYIQRHITGQHECCWRNSVGAQTRHTVFLCVRCGRPIVAILFPEWSDFVPPWCPGIWGREQHVLIECCFLSAAVCNLFFPLHASMQRRNFRPQK